MKNLEFTFSQMLRHAFMSGAGYDETHKINPHDLDRWMDYRPPEKQYDEIIKALREALRA